MKTVAIVQARVGSTRLPGKILRALAGRSVLSHVLDRVRAAAGVDETVVATTVAPADEAVAAEAVRCGVRVFRGDEDDVLSRYALAAAGAGADVVVRVTSDCPLFDSGLLGAMLGAFHASRVGGRPLDYLSNTVLRTFPRGLDAEIFTRAALERAAREATAPHEREHVTPYLYQHPDRFAVDQYARVPDLSAHRWTLDTPEDWELIRRVVEALGPRGERFSTDAVLDLLRRHPDWVALNAGVEQKPLGR